ncbi:DHA1 family bicyclomycin/chloramphenicol resistance-like MFS transporter [Kerstersia gyiorum]|uniref:Bcr/CflA family efflux transporter n=1 Tax=Kerstersia gyiorum TaxID=206506 RepID=A0A4Q7MN06_9BURK|nr:multidrug effflux MFS transporter [Kerstersia gyiorum]KAB0544590.1 multidrug effflux MFS transporter [Kerstersia gyiorum]RZS69736.1 DHA1 family bicyclomycin/chloramphenicol resistance-like MFS transporter [Kerstersia gyiorum]
MMSAPQGRPPFWLLAVITIASTMAMNLFVPALPAAGLELHASNGAMQATISVYILGLSAGQLVYGPIADSIGRRPTLMAGLILYVAGSLLAAFAGSLSGLFGARLLQALGGCAGLALGRAIARDTSEAHDAVRRLALLNLMMMLGPSLAPLLGGIMTSHTGWRTVFYMMTVIGAATLVLSWRLLPETLPNANRQTFHLGQVARNYRTLLHSRAFVYLSIGGGLTTTSMHAFISSAPFIFHDRLGRPLHEVGLYLCALIFGMSLGNAVTSRLVTRMAANRLLIGGTLLSLAAAASLAAQVAIGHLTVTGILLSMTALTCGAGIASPAILTKAISVDAKLIGSASGLYGSTQMLMGAICTGLAAAIGNPAVGAAAVLLGAAILAQVCLRRGLQHLPPEA